MDARSFTSPGCMDPISRHLIRAGSLPDPPPSWPSGLLVSRAFSPSMAQAGNVAYGDGCADHSIPRALPANLGNEAIECWFHLLGPHRPHFGGHTCEHAITVLLIELFSHEPHHEPWLVSAEAHHVVTSLSPPFLGTDPLRRDR